MRRPLLGMLALTQLSCPQAETDLDLIAGTAITEVSSTFKTDIEELPTCDKTAMFGSENPSPMELAQYWEAQWPGLDLTSREADHCYKCLGDLLPNVVISERGDYIAAITENPRMPDPVTPCSAEVYVNGEKVMAANPEIKLWLLNGISEEGVSTFMKVNLHGSSYNADNYADITHRLPNIPPLCQ